MQKPRIEPFVIISKSELEKSYKRSEQLEKIMSFLPAKLKNDLQYFIEWEKSCQMLIRERMVQKQNAK